MKKAILLALALVMVFALAACGGKDNSTNGNDDPLNRPGGSSSPQDTSTPAQNGEAPNLADILSGNGGGTIISGLDEAAKQAFISEAKADGYEVEFKADGSMVMTDTATGDTITQKPDGTWSVAEGGGSGDGNTVNVGGWPDNEFTKLIPKPDFDVISANVAGTQFAAMFENVKVADMRAYVEQVKAKGFTVDALTNDQEVQGVVIYTFAAYNADGWNIGITSISDGQYTLAVTKP